MAALSDDLRLILAHKHRTSARLRFLRFRHGLTAFTPLPRLSSYDEAAPPPQVVHHPSLFLHAAEDELGLASGALAYEAEFSATVDTPDGPIAVYLASFTSIDPPFEAAETHGGRFITITEAIGGSPVEMDLLRLAYTTLLG